MPRTTPMLVRELLQAGGDYDNRNKPSLVPFIATAAVWVNRIVTFSVTKVPAVTLGTDELELVERWLAAHFYQQADKGYTSRSTAGASGSFAGQLTNGLESTLYGQTALKTDFTGVLAMLNKRAVAGMVWGGKTRGEALTAEDRDI